MVRDGSAETVRKCSLVRIFPADIYPNRSISGQGRFRGDCAQVQSCQNLPCSHTPNMEPKWSGKVQGRLWTSVVLSESPLL